MMMCIGSGRRFDNRATGWQKRRQAEFTRKNMLKVRQTFLLEEKVGAGLGRSDVLQRRVSKGEAIRPEGPENVDP